MPQRWAIWFTIEGDLRFGSHHDLMRAMARIATRAELPLRYSRGFNPRPRLSLVCPRPVGVTTQDDMLVVVLDAPVDSQDMLWRLNYHAPRGMRFLRAESLQNASSPQARRKCYRLPVHGRKVPQLRRRLSELAQARCWPVERLTSTGPGKAMRAKAVDLRPLVEKIHLDGETLGISLVRHGDLWARPGEVLRLVGLDERVDLAGVVCTEIEYEM